MPIFVWALRFLATCLFGLMIFPAGFNTFFAHGETIAWSDTYLYLVGLLIATYGLRVAWMRDPTKWQLVGGYGAVLSMLTTLFAIGFLNILDT